MDEKDGAAETMDNVVAGVADPGVLDFQLSIPGVDDPSYNGDCLDWVKTEYKSSHRVSKIWDVGYMAHLPDGVEVD